MGNFDKSFDELLNLEFNNPYDILHKNEGESGYTFSGIYESANANWKGWDVIKRYIKVRRNLRKASFDAYKDEVLRGLTKEFYKTAFWEKMRLDELKNERIADLIFKFAVNTGIKRAVRYAQLAADVRIDGIVGINTLKALNSIDTAIFEKRYKNSFKRFYEKLARNNPDKYSKFLKGWQNRVILSKNLFIKSDLTAQA